MKKLLSAVSAAAVLAAFTACRKIDAPEISVADSSEEIIEITVGLTENTISEYIAGFNRSNDRYKLIVSNYGDSDKTVIECQNELKIDIISGKSPDIILCADTALYKLLLSKGVFADISGIYETEDILPNIRAICTEDDGRLCRVPLGFSVKTAITRAEDGIESCEIFSYSEMNNILRSLGPDEMLSADMRSVEYITRHSLLCDFTDIPNHSCSFDSDKFESALEFYKSIKQRIGDDSSDYRIRTYYTYLCNAVDISNALNYFGDEETLITPPEHARLEFSQSIAVSASASDDARKGAEEFIRYLVSDECLKEFDVWFPVTESGLEYSMNTEFFDSYDENNQPLYVSLDDEDIGHYTDYFKSIEQENYTSREVMHIFQEETEEYINNNLSAEECADMIQNRVSLYLSEQS